MSVLLIGCHQAGTEPGMKYMLSKYGGGNWSQRKEGFASVGAQAQDPESPHSQCRGRKVLLPGYRESGEAKGAQISDWEQEIRGQSSISCPYHPSGSPSE